MLLPSSQLRPILTLIAITGCLIVLFFVFRSSPTTITRGVSSSLPAGKTSPHELVEDVFNATLGFEKIFILNLPTRTDRLDAIILAAALSNIDVEVFSGVAGATVLHKALPIGADKLRDGEIGCWRGHADALRSVIQRNLSSVLILEDDADWDVRIKSQLRNFALSSHALTQPLSSTQPPFADAAYADATFPLPRDSSHMPDADLSFGTLPSTVTPKHSPYGDNWDMLWVGHCGMRFPSPHLAGAEIVPRGRVISSFDPTVPEKQFLKTLTTDDLEAEYPAHTRAYHHVAEGICSLGYAVTQAGARRLLHSITAMDVTAPYDIMLRRFCEGTHGRKRHNCLTMQPSLFKNHLTRGSTVSESDITDHGSEHRESAKTDVIRWSTKLNLETLLDGRTDFLDQYPDTSSSTAESTH